jgi:pimeloyl-ACP methyl ester carboxylesterase
MKKHTMTVSRGTFHIRESENGDGQPVVMLHGWPESSHCWEAVATFLDPNLRMIAPDLRGLGDSERTMDVKAYRKAELAKDILEIVDALGIDTFFLVGHDWGGIVAQELALLAPRRVKRLALMNIAVLTNPKGTQKGRDIIFAKGGIHFWYQYFQQQPMLPEAMIKGNEAVWIRYFFGREIHEGTIPAESIDEYIRCHSIENTPATAASYYRTMRHERQHWDAMAEKKFPMPGLYIHGIKDAVILPAFMEHMEDGFDSVEVVSIDAGHFVQEEKPREVAAQLNDFFARERQR